MDRSCVSSLRSLFPALLNGASLANGRQRKRHLFPFAWVPWGVAEGTLDRDSFQLVLFV